MTIRIAMWSGPRNISTAMMRSFGSRADTYVSDEPFYGCFLKQTGAVHPMADAIIAEMDCDWHSVMATLSDHAPGDRPIWYQKHMWHHMEGALGASDFSGFTHAFLIRDPARMIASYRNKMEHVSLAALGLERQADFFTREADRLGHAPPVIDSGDVLINPERTLASLCKSLGIAWDPAMLCWEPGRRTTDGIWASHWYDRVEASTGFETAMEAAIDLPDALKALESECRPFYEQLRRFKL